MEEDELQAKLSELKERYQKVARQAAGLKQKAKYLELQYGDAREREKNTNELVMELLERQRELNVMLNRANIMLNRSQEVMALTSLEFNEMAKALPEPKKAEWSERVAKVNELFRKTGIQDAEVMRLESLNELQAETLETDEMKRESEEAFPRAGSIWDSAGRRDPPRVEAEIVEEAETPGSGEEARDSRQAASADEDKLLFGPRRKSWWRRTA